MPVTQSAATTSFDVPSPSGGNEQGGYGRERGRQSPELNTKTKSVWLAP